MTATKKTIAWMKKASLFLSTDGKLQWSGKGRKPDWLLDELERGLELEDFLNPHHPDYKKRKALILDQAKTNPEEDEGTTARAVKGARKVETGSTHSSDNWEQALPASKTVNRVVRKSLMDLQVKPTDAFRRDDTVFVTSTERYGVIMNGPFPSLVSANTRAYLVSFETDSGVREIEVDSDAMVPADVIDIKVDPKIEAAIETLVRIAALEAKFDLFQKNNRRLPAAMKPDMTGITPNSFKRALNRLRRAIANPANY